MSPHLIAGLTTGGFGAAGFVGLIFFCVYARTKWWTHPWGRHVMLFTIVVELLMMASFARLIFGDYPGRTVIIMFLSWCLFGAMTQRLWVQVSGTRRLRRRAREIGEISPSSPPRETPRETSPVPLPPHDPVRQE